MRNKSWTETELETLRDLWGVKTIPNIAKILRRTETAITVKAVRLKLGSFINSSEYMTANQAAKLIGVDLHLIIDFWIPKYGLKSTKKKPRGAKTFTLIRTDVFVDWLENNQDKWDSRKVELYALASEPTWLKDKREKDELLPIRKNQYWTKQEDEIMLAYRARGATYTEIGNRLGRSVSAVRNREERLKKRPPKMSGKTNINSQHQLYHVFNEL